MGTCKMRHTHSQQRLGLTPVTPVVSSDYHTNTDTTPEIPNMVTPVKNIKKCNEVREKQRENKIIYWLERDEGGGEEMNRSRERKERGKQRMIIKPASIIFFSQQ